MTGFSTTKKRPLPGGRTPMISAARAELASVAPAREPFGNLPPRRPWSVGASVPTRPSGSELRAPESPGLPPPLATECWSLAAASDRGSSGPSRSRSARWPPESPRGGPGRRRSGVAPGSTTTNLGEPQRGQRPAAGWPIRPGPTGAGRDRPAPRPKDGWGHSSSWSDGTYRHWSRGLRCQPVSALRLEPGPGWP